MKRILKIFGWLVLLAVGALVATVALAFAGTASIRDGVEIAGRTRTVKDGIVSLFVLDAGDGTVALVDAGNDTKGTRILAELARRGLRPDAVRAIFLTHGHFDHVAACHLFPQAQVYALAPDVALAEGRARTHGLGRIMPLRDTGTRVTRALADGAKVTVGTLTVEAFALPGHTAGSAAYLAGGVLFLGDSAEASKDHKLLPGKRLFSEDPAQNRAALKALAARLAPRKAEVQALAFAHSGTLPGLEPLLDFAAAH